MGLIPVLGSVRIGTGYRNLVTIISRYTHVPITLNAVFSPLSSLLTKSPSENNFYPNLVDGRSSW